MKNYDNEMAAAGIFTFVLVFFLAAILFVLIGFGIDRVTLIAARMFDGTPASQLRFDVVNLQLLAFRIEPFLLLIGLGFNYWVGEMRQYSGMADVSTMIFASAEMITITFVVIVLTLFGGFGIDTVVNFVNHMIVINPDLDLFLAVQYIAPVFYGIMLLVIVGVIAQFFMTCVQVVDYTQSRSG